jgi:hypothetical protein
MKSKINRVSEPASDFTKSIRPQNVSLMLSDDEWYHFCNELGEMNERLNDGWSVKEILIRADRTTGYGYQYVTSHDLFHEMDLIEFSNA